jgi:hypothetical protein
MERDELPERFGVALGGMLLDGTDDGIDQQHGENEDGVGPLLSWSATDTTAAMRRM